MALLPFFKKFLSPKKGEKSRANKKNGEKTLSAKQPKEKEIGIITHYFGNISVGVIKLKSELKAGDKIHIKGAHDDFKQTVKSIQIDNQNISIAKKGSEIGIKVAKRVHENDRVYKIDG